MSSKKRIPYKPLEDGPSVQGSNRSTFKRVPVKFSGELVGRAKFDKSTGEIIIERKMFK